MRLDEGTDRSTSRTTRRKVVKTSAKLAYAVPLVAASFKLSGVSVSAAVSGGGPVGCPSGTLECNPGNPAPVPACCAFSAPEGPLVACCAVNNGIQRCNGCLREVRPGVRECILVPGSCFTCADFPGQC